MTPDLIALPPLPADVAVLPEETEKKTLGFRLYGDPLL